MNSTTPYAPGEVALAGRTRAPVRGRGTPTARIDAYLVGVILLTLTTVWRLQNTVPVLAVLQLPSIAAVLSYVFFATNRIRRRSLGSIRHPVTSALVIFVACIALSAPLGAFFGNTFAFLRQDYIKTFLMFVVVASCIRDLADLETMLGAQLLGALVYSVVILTKFRVDSSGRFDELLYYDANDLAMILAMTLPMTVYFLRPRARMMWRLVALATLGVILVGIVKTGSRGGFLGIVAVMGYLVLRYRAIPKRTRLSAVALFAVGLLVVGSAQYWQMMATMLNPKADYNYAGNSEGGRVEVWKRGLGYLREYPVLGVGAANFGWAEENLGRGAERKKQGRGTQRLTAHNSFVLAAAELGIVGFAVFCGVLWRASVSARRNVRTAMATQSRHPDEAAIGQALIASLLAYVVCGFFLSQTYAPMLHVLLGLIVALAKVQRERLRQAGAAVGSPPGMPPRIAVPAGA